MQVFSLSRNSKLVFNTSKVSELAPEPHLSFQRMGLQYARKLYSDNDFFENQKQKSGGCCTDSHIEPSWPSPSPTPSGADMLIDGAGRTFSGLNGALVTIMPYSLSWAVDQGDTKVREQ
mmetsp:Transcript_124492/g.215770  ORF Transcript_124492/g.215770 Transcript_124492/m.215770 type:complete len:119 (-) Transcript_124492:1112-1468(-)